MIEHQVAELFRVVQPDGKTYRIYTDGTTEGFDGSSMVFNYFPVLWRLKAAALASEIYREDMETR